MKICFGLWFKFSRDDDDDNGDGDNKATDDSKKISIGLSSLYRIFHYSL